MKWEYLFLTYAHVAKEVKAPAGSSREYIWSFSHTYYIWRPGAGEAETREVEDGKPRVSDILNELGGEGWELIDVDTTRSAVGEVYGWLRASFPVGQRYLMKRPVT